MGLGYCQLGSALNQVMVISDQNGAPKDPASAPTFRIYGGGALMPNGSGTLTQLDTGAITGATNASPIVVTSAAHGLTTGTRVNIVGALGNTAVNGEWTVTVIDPNSFSLQSSAGNGAYTSGGTWHTEGAYLFSFTPSGGNGFAAGSVYTVLVNYSTGGNSYAVAHTFAVY